MSGVTDLTAPTSVSLMVSPLCSTVQAPTPSLYARFSVPSLFPGLLSFAEEGDTPCHSPEGTSAGVRD